MGLKSCHKIPKAIHFRRQNLIGGFKVKIDQSVNEKRIDSKIKTISAITFGPLDVPSSEARRRLSWRKRYRTVPLSGTFTVESGGVFVPQNSKRHDLKAPKIWSATLKLKVLSQIDIKELISKSILFPRYLGGPLMCRVRRSIGD